MGIHLVVIEGRPLGGIIELKPGRLMIGRDPACQLRPKSQTVSQFHCSVTRQDDEVTVIDLGSRNGTLVNNQFLHPGDAIQLVEGDRLQIGQLIFAFHTSAVPREESPPEEDWAAHTHPTADDNFRAPTLEVPALSDSEPGSADTLVEHLEIPTTFAYRHIDDVTGATCLGLNWLQVEGEARIRAMRKSMVEVIARSHSRRVVLDFEEVDTIPSMAVATILAMAVRCNVPGGGLRLCGLRPSVKRTLVALKVDELAHFYSSRDTALNDPWE
jgi:anti-anti-sigma factor